MKAAGTIDSIVMRAVANKDLESARIGFGERKLVRIPNEP
jgi:hypothetical protein